MYTHNGDGSSETWPSSVERGCTPLLEADRAYPRGHRQRCRSRQSDPLNTRCCFHNPPIGQGEDPDLRSGCAISVGGLTDNRGNKFAVAKLLTTKWPLAAFVAELAAQLEARDVLLDVSWVPRELNAEADAITNGGISWLSGDLQVKPTFEELPFTVLKDLLAASSIFYKNLEAVNVEGVTPTKKALGLLKVRDPWG